MYSEQYTYNKYRYLDINPSNRGLPKQSVDPQTGGKKSNKHSGPSNQQKTKKCKIDKTDKIVRGDGGSNAFIIITKDHRVFKIFPLFFREQMKGTDKEHKKFIIREHKEFETEILIYNKLTKHIINPGISEHYVRMISNHECENAKDLFKDCPPYIEWLKMTADEKKAHPTCGNLMQGAPYKRFDKNFEVIEIEYCNYSCKEFIKDCVSMTIDQLEIRLDIFFFQILYTLLSTQKVYPCFMHNDLFMRNILGTREKDMGRFYTYNYTDKNKNYTYMIPQKMFFPKINDFGMTNLDDKIKNTPNNMCQSVYKDFYNILYDVYDGGNLGALSLMNQCKDDDKKEQIRRYFSTFFDVDRIDELKKKSGTNMTKDWNNIIDDDFRAYIGFVEPRELMITYFFDIFAQVGKNIGTFNSIGNESQ